MVMKKVFSNSTVNGTVLFVLLSVAAVSCKKNSNTPVQSPGVIKEPLVLECDDPISNGGTLVNDPDRPVDYRVNCQLALNGDVTIEPGTVIEFATDAGFKITKNGSLASNGNSSTPVELTGVDKTKGSWSGVIFDSDDTKNKLIYTNISYAGGKPFNSNGDHGAVIIWSGTRVTLQNCNITNAMHYGLNANYHGANITLENNSFKGNDVPMHLNGSLLSVPSSSDDYTGNEKDVVELRFYTSTISNAATWHKINVPYLTKGATNLVINADVTIEPGTDIMMGQGTGIKVNEKGGLKILGTASAPITFRGEHETPGAWAGIGYHFTANPINEVGHARIMHAGANMKGAIYMWAKPVLKVHNVAFSDLKTCAMYAAPSTSSPNTNLGHSNNTYVSVGGQICGD